jgi:hypothetical protein
VKPVVEALLVPVDVYDDPPPPPRAVVSVAPEVMARVEEPPSPPGLGNVVVAVPPAPTVIVYDDAIPLVTEPVTT